MIELFTHPHQLNMHLLVTGLTIVAALTLCNPAIPRLVVLGMLPVYAMGAATLIATLDNLRFLSILSKSEAWPFDPFGGLLLHAVLYVLILAPIVWLVRRVLWRWFDHRSRKI